MKFIFLVPVALIVCSCSTKPENSSVAIDSVATDTTLLIAEERDEESEDEYSLLRNAVEALIEKVNSKSETYYTIQVNASGYEYQSRTTWTFDENFSLISYYIDWAAEANEGETYYFFKNDKVFAVEDKNFYDGGVQEIKLAHEDFGGISFTNDEAADTITPPQRLDRNYLTTTNQDASNQLFELRKLLNENEDDITGDEELTLRLENQNSIGEMEVTETVEITLDKKLLAKLIK